jgi:hypothetical protein
MSVVRNSLAVIGAIGLLLLLIGMIKLNGLLQLFNEFDPRAQAFYEDFIQRIIESRSGVEALVIRVPVVDGLDAAVVDESIRFIANELNIKNVGELPLYKEVESMSGTQFRYIKIYMLCNAMTAASLLNYNDAFSSYLPCRITLLEDKDGKLWLYTMNMDLLIYGGRPLPPALKAEAIKIRDIMLSIMQRAAQGDF